MYGITFYWKLCGGNLSLTDINNEISMEVLLLGAAACITALILSVWLMTFARWFRIEGVDGKFLVDYKTMIRAHVDYAL